MIKKLSFLVVLMAVVQGTCTAADTKSASILVISCSLNPDSRSALLAKEAVKSLKAQGQQVDFLDLRDYKLPIANGHDQSAYDDPNVKTLHDRILNAKGIIVASPIYNYSVASSTKNLFELTSHPHKNSLSGKAWANKTIGFIGACGSPRSTLAMLPFLNSLMMDAKAVIVPAFVVAASPDFNDKNQPSAEIQEAIVTLTKEMARFTKAFA